MNRHQRRTAAAVRATPRAAPKHPNGDPCPGLPWIVMYPRENLMRCHRCTASIHVRPGLVSMAITGAFVERHAACSEFEDAALMNDETHARVFDRTAPAFVGQWLEPARLRGDDLSQLAGLMVDVNDPCVPPDMRAGWGLDAGIATILEPRASLAPFVENVCTGAGPALLREPPEGSMWFAVIVDGRVSVAAYRLADLFRTIEAVPR